MRTGLLFDRLMKDKVVSLTFGIILIIPPVTFFLAGGGFRNAQEGRSGLEGILPFDFVWQILIGELFFTFYFGLLLIINGIVKE